MAEAQQRETILLVDDEQGIRRFLGMSLADLGFIVHTAENGREALEIFRRIQPPIVLTDIKMPHMDGIELLKAVKAESPHTEVIMVSGHGDMDLAIQSLKHDAADFITKPINDEILEAVLARAMEKISLRRQVQRYTCDLEELVLEKTALHQQLFDEAPCFISVQDRDLRIVAANRRFKEAFGDTSGTFCFQVYKNREECCEQCPILQTFEDGVSRQHETVVTARTGEQYNVLVWTAAIRDAHGRITHVMEMSTNITQIRKLQDHLTSLGLMLGSVSHGVKGMLTALDGGLYRLESGLAKNDAARRDSALATVKEITGRIKSMVLDILYYAKSRELHTECSDVAEVAGRAASMVEPRAAEQSIAFVRDFAPNLGRFEIDPNGVGSALVNFLENAVDACAADTSGKAREVRFSVSANQRWVLLEIEDNGLGMDAETRDKIFTLFFSSKGRKGTGLGLFISNQVVEQHGGAIDVDSEPGRGSTFTIRLPRVLPASVKEPGGKESDGPCASREHA